MYYIYINFGGNFMEINNLYNSWLENATDDPDLTSELLGIQDNEEEIYDRFYRELEFGTGGLRGIIGAGTNRMNIYNIAKATQGFSQYIIANYKNPTVAIAYDSRIKSDLFAKKAASVFATNGIKVYIYSELMPTPMLSFAVRYLKCSAGVVVTASHNPSKYNGYKAYGPDGCQLDLDASKAVLDIINSLDVFKDVKSDDFDKLIKSGMIEYISDEVIDNYISSVKSQLIDSNACKNSDFKVVYTPLHGAGNKPVRRTLNEIGVKNLVVVPEQELPNGNFPTAPYPNPEIREAFGCALELAKKENPDLLLATDPDSDRVGIAVKHNDEYHLMTGNQVGAMLLDYMLSRKSELGTLPKNPVAIKTIVTTNLVEKIAKKYNCYLYNVLTGFKFIGGVIAELEEKGEENRCILGFEESYGYLSGSYVRDKDAVVASMLICEMACYFKSKGLTLIDYMNSLYKEYGYYSNVQFSFVCEGASGTEKMNSIMAEFRAAPPSQIGGYKVVTCNDYLNSTTTDVLNGNKSEIDLPKSNVLIFNLENSSSVAIRPSGTEPKIKVYIESVGENKDAAEELSEVIKKDISKLMGF